MATGTIDNHINPENVVIFNENILSQQVCKKKKSYTIDNEINFHRTKMENPVRIKKSGRNIWTLQQTDGSKPMGTLPDLFRVVPANDQPHIKISRWWKIYHHIEIHHDQ